MSDLISKADLKRLTTKRNSIWNEITDADGRGLDQILDSMPTVDAVPVIRCKDCVCWDTSWKPTRAIEGAYWCSNNDIYMESDDYCSLGERKES